MKKRTKIIIATLAILVIVFTAVVVFIVFAYKHEWPWTGFVGGKDGPMKLWDWLKLLFVPVAVVVVGSGFTVLQSWTARKTAREENETDRQIARERTQEQSLQTYLDRMGRLLLDRNLRGDLDSRPDFQVANLARAWTLTILVSLDGKHKRSVIEFLYRSELIFKNEPIVTLKEADLSGAVLSEATLDKADLSGANLNKAILHWTGLSEANLSNTNLIGASMSDADLTKADLTGAKLQNARLIGASLQKANLSNADLSGADLREADLTEANLHFADLRRANMSNAIITPDQIDGATQPFLEDVTLPNGSKYTGTLPESWGEDWSRYRQERLDSPWRFHAKRQRDRIV